MSKAKSKMPIIVWFLVCISVVQASIHYVHGPSVGWKASERMFANGPGKNESRIRVEFNATPLETPPKDVEFAIVVAIYDIADLSILPEEYCSTDYTTLNATDHIVGQVFSNNETTGIHGSEEFVVQHTGSQIVILSTCMRSKPLNDFFSGTKQFPFVDFGIVDVFNITASISFKNSYGYLPGLMWGLLPFSGGLFLAYILALVLFLILIYCHRGALIRLHYFILTVLILMTLETLSWLITYWQLNTTGEALCCPYPTMILVSTGMKVISKLVARVLTMIICLGYGIARPTLTLSEVLLVFGLSLCYVVSAGILEILHLSNQAQGNFEPPVTWETLVIATDVCFGGWIFSSLLLTRKTLRRTGQSAKYRMYDILFKVLVVFMILAFAFTAFENGVYSRKISGFPWQDMWMMWAGSRVLNFGIVVVVAIIWRPTQTSQLYAHSLQLPSSDEDCTKQEIEMVTTITEVDEATDDEGLEAIDLEETKELPNATAL